VGQDLTKGRALDPRAAPQQFGVLRYHNRKLITGRRALKCRGQVPGVEVAVDLPVVKGKFEHVSFVHREKTTPLTVFEALAMGKPIVATDADGLVDVLTDERDAIIVPKRDARALANGIIRMMDEPDTRARLSAAASHTAGQYDITQFVRKMEQLYELLHRVSRATHRRGVLAADLSFLTTKAPA